MAVNILPVTNRIKIIGSMTIPVPTPGIIAPIAASARANLLDLLPPYNQSQRAYLGDRNQRVHVALRTTSWSIKNFFSS